MKTHLGVKSTEVPIDSEGRTMHLGVNNSESTSLLQYSAIEYYV